MHSMRSIVVGVDFSACSRAALVQAARIARWNDAELHIVHAVLPLVATELAEALGRSREAMVEELAADASRQLAEFCRGIAMPNAVSHHVAVAHPFQIMMETVREMKADLAVVGIVGADASSRGAGTIATKCVRKLPTRVLMVHPSQAEGFERIVACIDFSETSGRAFEQALRVAEQDRARLTALHVFHAPWHNLHYRAPTPESSPAFQKQYIDRLRTRLEQFVQPGSDCTADIDLECELMDRPNYGRAIVEYAREHEADLVVLGTEGNTNLRYLLLGSTAERVLREVECSVLSIKPARYSQAE